MRLQTFETVSVVHQLRCDRCGKEPERGEVSFKQMPSIDFKAGSGSIFGDRNRVELDLCEICLRETLGTWLHVKTPADTPYAKMCPTFKSASSGGEIPQGDDK